MEEALKELAGQLWIVIGCMLVLVAGAIAFFRWFLRKPKKVPLPDHLVEEMTRFSEDLRRIEDNVDAVSDQLSVQGKHQWRRVSRKMLKRLRSVNKLMARLNALFDEEQARMIVRQRMEIRARKHKKAEETAARKAKVKHTPGPGGGISEDEIKNIDWDEFSQWISPS